MRIGQAQQRTLRSFTHPRIGRHPRRQGLERVEMGRGRRHAQTVVERVLAGGALGTIELREDRVHVQVVPRPLVERAGHGGVGETRAMGFFNRLEFAIALDSLAPAF